MTKPRPTEASSRLKMERELFDAVKAQRKSRLITYSLSIDTYNLFCNATDALKPIFEKVSPSRRPSAGEYVRFAEIFIADVSNRAEERLASTVPNSITEKELRSTIRDVVRGTVSPSEIPNAESIISFERSVKLFGADFDKSALVRKIERQERSAWRKGDTREIEALKDTKRRVIEDDAIDVYNATTGKKSWTKNYRGYSNFLGELLKETEDRNLPGFYKSFIDKGHFTTHNEKGVDTSLAIEAISLAYESRKTVQVFCIADTDFLPVFKKLDDLGVDFLVFYVGDNIPFEIAQLQSQNKVVLLDFAEMCDRVIDVIVAQFGNYDEGGYIGDNADLYRAVVELDRQEMQAEWEALMYERELEHIAKLAAEYENGGSE